MGGSSADQGNAGEVRRWVTRNADKARILLFSIFPLPSAGPRQRGVCLDALMRANHDGTELAHSTDRILLRGQHEVNAVTTYKSPVASREAMDSYPSSTIRLPLQIVKSLHTLKRCFACPPHLPPSTLTKTVRRFFLHVEALLPAAA